MAVVVLRQICFLFNFDLVEIWSFGANSTVGLRKPKEEAAGNLPMRLVFFVGPAT